MYLENRQTTASNIYDICWCSTNMLGLEGLVIIIDSALRVQTEVYQDKKHT